MKNLEYEYNWSFVGTSREELKEIYNYISQTLKEPQIAERLTRKIIKEIDRLETSPYLGQEVHVKPRNEQYSDW